MKNGRLALLLLTLSLGLLGIAGCKEDTPVIIKTISDAQHARIGVMTGTTSGQIVSQRLPEAKVQSFDNITDAFAALKSGQLDGVVTAYSSGILLQRSSSDLVILDERLSAENNAVAVRKGNDQLLRAVDKIISDLKAEGIFASMAKRWFKTDPGPYEEIEIPVPTTGTPLRIGVSATREPFSFVDDKGRITGHDGDLARLIAQRLNRPIEFQDMKFMALIPALQSGKIDLIVTGMLESEERRKFVDFTQPYYANFQVLVVKGAAASNSGQSTFWGDFSRASKAISSQKIATFFCGTG